MLFTHPTLSESDIKLLASASQQAYSNQANLNGWTAITPELISYGLNSEFIVEDTFTRNAPDGGDANATVFKSGDNLIISFIMWYNLITFVRKEAGGNPCLSENSKT